MITKGLWEETSVASHQCQPTNSDTDGDPEEGLFTYLLVFGHFD